ncbi:DUF5565 family protein [Segniliparus rugosus]|uniref:RNA ligase n=1 Tax=Segniliparus rugosus (strain ATCC BAA-974 / DSM 45345 / CCUG 50838 / CIP 108380 / JCM 13579 / CDC 945) TaxID=679197 RepID=E5XRV7_SEGRC|nr:DUF5565 family protein [Segniliparus rugosus]EFV12972.1 hypothetical protein HMPREF9336_02229 [Segniliparus rugosus ATCC BAA-974]
MKKIPCLFERDFTDRRRPVLLDKVTPGCEWVLAGEGKATRKWDGTACLIRDGKLYKRYDAKNGRTPPPDFEPAQPAPDPVTGHWPGWVPVSETAKEDRWHREGWDAFGRLEALVGRRFPDTTYELIGPKVNGNHEGADTHLLVQHGDWSYSEIPRDFDGLGEWFRGEPIEGVVFHHPDGRMAKIRKADYGMRRSD